MCMMNGGHLSERERETLIDRLKGGFLAVL